MVNETPIACRPNVFDPKQKERYKLLRRKLSEAVLEVTELEHGYAWRYPGDPALFVQLAEWITLERLCCPFLRFSLEAEPDLSAVVLRLSGPEGTKEFLETEFRQT